MCFAHSEAARFYSGGRLDQNLFEALRCQTISIPVFVGEWACRIVESFKVNILQVGRIVGADPTPFSL